MNEKKQTTIEEETIAEVSGQLLSAIRKLSSDPYIQMAALKSAASVIEYKIASCALKAGVAAALSNAINLR